MSSAAAFRSAFSIEALLSSTEAAKSGGAQSSPETSSSGSESKTSSPCSTLPPPPLYFLSPPSFGFVSAASSPTPMGFAPFVPTTSSATAFGTPLAPRNAPSLETPLDWRSPCEGTENDRHTPAYFQRKQRTVYHQLQIRQLEEAFARQQYMVGSDRVALAARLGLSETQVRVWFQNRRSKWRKELREQASFAQRML